jgi:hypothetical protein
LGGNLASSFEIEPESWTPENVTEKSQIADRYAARE